MAGQYLNYFVQRRAEVSFLFFGYAKNKNSKKKKCPYIFIKLPIRQFQRIKRNMAVRQIKIFLTLQNARGD